MLDVQLRLDRAVGAEPVAENAIQVEQVEHQLAVLVEHEVVEEDRDVVVAARQAQAGGLVAGVPVVEQVVAAEHALVDVLRGEIEVMVMIPERAQRLGRVAGRRGDAVSSALFRWT